MGKLKGVMLLVLVLCYTMQVALSQEGRRQRRAEREGPEEEQRQAEEEERRRREKTAEEERQHRSREREEWQEEEERGRPGRRERTEWEEEEERERPPIPVPFPGQGEDLFVLREGKRVISTEAGEMRVVRGFGGRMVDRPLHVGFITMEPRSLFIPQYLDSSLIIFIRRGSSLFSSFFTVDCVVSP